MRSTALSFVCAAGATLVASVSEAQVAPTYSNASLHGTYAGMAYSFQSNATQVLWPTNCTPTCSFPQNLASPLGFQSVIGTVTFDGAGTMTYSIAQDEDGVVTPQTGTNAYSVAANGTITGGVDFNVTGTVLQNGKIVMMNSIAGHDPQVLLFVKQEDASDNQSEGANALLSNTTGIENAAFGAFSMHNNTTGSGNNAQGYEAMYSNTTGSNNSAIGLGALFASTTGVGNNAVGLTALENMTSGSRNTAVGNNAGLSLTSGSYNTYIGWGANGSTGVAVPSENYVTRIGVTYQDPNVTGTPTTYISGIHNTGVTGGLAVYVTASGQLGFSASSERYKTDITPIGNSGKLSQLRPVSFHVKSDPSGSIQYGLIAEEVDKVYPELVIRDDEGRIQGVRYDELAPMLLSEVQKQQQAMAGQAARIDAQAAEIHALKAQQQQVGDMQRQLADMQAVLAKLQSGDERLARR
jgi:hypothetical protein